MKMPCHTPVSLPWRVAGISLALPVSRVLSEEQRKTGYLQFYSEREQIIRPRATINPTSAREIKVLITFPHVNETIQWERRELAPRGDTPLAVHAPAPRLVAQPIPPYFYTHYDKNACSECVHLIPIVITT